MANKKEINSSSTFIPLDSDFTNAKIGDKITYLNHGVGEIIDINKDRIYPIGCNIGDILYSFTIDGKFRTWDTTPVLVKEHHTDIILCTKVKIN